MKNVNKNIIGEGILSARKDLGITQVQLSNLCGFSDAYLGKVEKGYERLSEKTENRVFQALGVLAIVKGFIKELKT